MGADTFKDHTINFLSWMNDHHKSMTPEEKIKLCEGFEKALSHEPVEKLLRSMKSTILSWILEWKAKEEAPHEGAERKRIREEFPDVLQKYYEAVSLCDFRELSGIEEKGFKIIKDYYRSHIEELTGNRLEQSEDLRG